ncbi:uncharacterized protein, partial [Pseudorasbora parva]|uniref:uncharacterized protein n=1 Tax=Pseudorasbora parva TaxID=51549 RepID=UPI00351DE33E
YKVNSERWKANTDYTCEVTHQGKTINVTKNFNAKLTLTLKPPIERELFVNNKVVLEAVVSGDKREIVEKASVLCKVNDELVHTIVTGNIDSVQGISQFIRVHNITIDTNKWFDGEMVTCSIHDTNNRDIKQEISFDKGDGQIPTIFIYRPDTTNTDAVSLVCEVTSRKLGDVYIMWKVRSEPYIEGSTSAPIRREDSVSVLSILTISKQQYEDQRTIITCAVMHANMTNIGSPLQVSTSRSKQPECPDDY